MVGLYTGSFGGEVVVGGCGSLLWGCEVLVIVVVVVGVEVGGVLGNDGRGVVRG